MHFIAIEKGKYCFLFLQGIHAYVLGSFYLGCWTSPVLDTWLILVSYSLL